MFRTLFIFSGAFLALLAGDLASTYLALQAGAGEYNPNVAASGGIHLGRALAINLTLLACVAPAFAWGWTRRAEVDPRYLTAPYRAALNFNYLNPFSDRNRPRALFQFIAIGFTILFFRAFVIFNNLLLAADLPDIVSPIIRAIHALVEGPAAYALLITLLLIPFWLAGLHVAGRLARAPSARGAAARSTRPAVL